MRKIWNYNYLCQYVKEYNIELLKTDDNKGYSNIKINRNTKINFVCNNDNCNEKYHRGFRELVKIGAFCKTCTKEISSLRHKQTCLENYGVENPSQSEEIKKKKKETHDKNYPKIKPKEETIEIDLNGIQEKFKPIYEILKKNNCNTITINKYKQQEKYICNNPNIIDIKYMESGKEDIPFDKIIWIIKCTCCNKIVEDWYWSYNYKSTNGSKSIIRIDNREKQRGINNTEDLFSKPFFDKCIKCSRPHIIKSFDELVSKLKEKNAQLLLEYDILDENYNYPLYTNPDKQNGQNITSMIKLKYKKTGEIIESHISFILRNIPVPTSQRTIGVSKESIHCLDFISMYCNVIIKHAYNNIHGEHLSPVSLKKADGYIDVIELDIFNLLQKKLLDLCNKSDDIIIDFQPNYTKCFLDYQGKFWHDKVENKIRDAQKKNEFFNNGYNVIIINQNFYNKLIKTDLYKEYLPKLHEIWLTYDQNIETKLPERIKMSDERKKNKHLPIYIRQRKEGYYRVDLDIKRGGKTIDICIYGHLGKATQIKNGTSHLCFSNEELMNRYLKPISDILCKFINKDIDKEQKNNLINKLYHNYIKFSLNKKIDIIKQDVGQNLYHNKNK